MTELEAKLGTAEGLRLKAVLTQLEALLAS